MSEFRFPPVRSDSFDECPLVKQQRTPTENLAFLSAGPSSAATLASLVRAQKSARVPRPSDLFGVTPDPKKIVIFDIQGYETKLKIFLNKYTEGWMYGITWQNTPLFAKGHLGYLRYPWDCEPNTNLGNAVLDTSRRVHIGSACKPITAVAILRLLRERGMGADSTIGPWLEIPNSWGWYYKISSLLKKATFRQLLSHKTGLDDQNTNGDFMDIGDSGWYGTLPFAAGLGTFKYANANYYLCRMLAWRLLGNEYPSDFLQFEIDSSALFANYIRTKILGPIGINEVFWGPSGKLEHTPLAYEPPKVLGKSGLKTDPNQSFERRVGPMGLFLSMEELLHFHRTLYSTSDLLTHQEVSLMVNGHSSLGNAYGLGLEFSAVKYPVTGRHFGHAGDIDVAQLAGLGQTYKNRYWMRTRLVSVPFLGFHVAVWTNYTAKLYGEGTEGGKKQGLTNWLSEWFEESIFGI